MKSLLLVMLSFVSIQALSATHKCVVYSSVQVYDKATMAYKYTENMQTQEFIVSEKAHDIPTEFDFIGSKGVVGHGNIMTGTLLDTADGDVIQAGINFKLHDVPGAASLVMSIDGPMAKAITVLEKQTETEMFLMPVDLKCTSI